LDAAGELAPLSELPPAAVPPLLFVGCGVADSLLPSSRRFAARLDERGIAHRYEQGPGGHTWEAWDWQLRSFLEMLNWA